MPRPDVSEERRSQILDAALAVFSRLGFHEARMDDIARESGLSKGALYLYFKSKDAIISGLMRFIFDRELKDIRAIRDADGSARERLLTITRLFAGEMERMAVALPIMFELYASAGRNKSVRLFLREFYAEFRSLIAAIARQGIDRGELRGAPPEEIAITLGAIYEGLTVLWVIDPQTVRWSQQAEASVTLVLDALRL